MVAKAKTNKTQRYGLVTMETLEQAQKCVNILNETELKGKKITVKIVSHAY